MRKVILFISLLSFVSFSYAQLTTGTNSVNRKGLTVGFSVGGGLLTMSENDQLHSRATTTLPNLRIGYMLNEKLAIQLLLPSSVYKAEDKQRGFEGVLLSGQYWIKDGVWLLGGLGMTLDAPAFWTVEDPATAEFNVGFPAIALAAGYELWSRKNFVIDAQYRIFAGQAQLSDGGSRKGVSNMLSIGFNWY